MNAADHLPVAVRAWTEHSRPRRTHPRPPIARHILVIDTETSTDLTQALTFGCYRYCYVDHGADGTVTVTTVAEGLFHADDLPETDSDGYAALVTYARTHDADVDLTYRGCHPDWRLGLSSRSEFVERWLYRVAYRDQGKRGDREPATVVLFNAPFDLSRLAGRATDARGQGFAGGFSLDPWVTSDGTPIDWRPTLRVKSIDAKRSMMGFSQVEEERRFRGHLLDLRTLVFALTNASHSLASACQAFGVRHGKMTTDEYGHITATFIDYCRRDVQATTELYEKVTEEYARHPIALQDTKAYSPASLAKRYLHSMGINPILDRVPDFPDDVLGYAMSAFYGGRAEAHMRHTPAPVVVCDFVSMYPTVDALMKLWDFLTCESVELVDAADEIQALVDSVTLDQCFDPDTWPGLVGVAQVLPDGDVLPVRAQYGPQPGWNIGINPLHSTEPLWYTIPDLVASALLTGKPPRILRAVRFVPAGERLGTLTPTWLRNQVPVDPSTQDFFCTVVEQRQTVKTSDPRSAGFLKVLANAGSYGIFAEMNREDLGASHRETVTVHGAGAPSWSSKVGAPERPGEYCFPPIAACITGAARLMLAMLERCVTDAGGTWVFCDTDSMAIVADRDGNLVPCPGDPTALPDGRPAVRALTLDQVQAIRERFTALNPYRADTVADMLKVEFSGHCYAISAKRYALYHLDSAGYPLIASTTEDADTERADGDAVEDIGDKVNIDKNSEHGLGHLLNPTDPEAADRSWIRQLWHYIVATAHGLSVDEPTWLDRAALTQMTVSSPTLLRPFTDDNAWKAYPEQVKPFNFLLVGHVAPLGHPPGADPERFHFIAPYDRNPARWEDLSWRNLHGPHGPTYRAIPTRWDRTQHDDQDQPPHLVHLQSYRHVLTAYTRHPEHKANGPDGTRCRSDTVGLLRRRTVQLAVLKHIGKEANRLDDIEAGIISSQDEVLTDYTGPATSFGELVLPALDSYSTAQLAEHTGLGDRETQRIRAARAISNRATRETLTRLAVDAAITDLNNAGIDHAWKDTWPSTAYANAESILSQWRDTRTNPRVCPCRCGTALRPRQTYATEACRKRVARRG